MISLTLLVVLAQVCIPMLFEAVFLESINKSLSVQPGGRGKKGVLAHCGE